MNIAVVDDLESDRRHLCAQITECCAHKQLDCRCLEYAGGEEFLAAWQPGLCAAVFLDVLMGGLTGIETAERLRQQDAQLPIIFTTSETSFALQSYRVHAMDYLVKPVSSQQLQWCMEKLTLAAPARQPVLELREAESRGVSRLVRLPLQEILYIRAEGHSVVVHTIADTHRTRSTFRQIKEMLPKNGCFMECGRGILVNFGFCTQVDKGVIRLRDGQTLPFSLRQQSAVEYAWLRYLAKNAPGGG